MSFDDAFDVFVIGVLYSCYVSCIGVVMSKIEWLMWSVCIGVTLLAIWVLYGS